MTNEAPDLLLAMLECRRHIKNHTMIKPEVTAVGRVLKSNGTEQRIHKIIAVNNAGKVHTIVEKTLITANLDPGHQGK